MGRLKRTFKVFPRLLALLTIIPILIYVVLLFVNSMARVVSISICIEPLQYYSNDYLVKHGNKYTALDMVYYIREKRDRRYCEECKHENVLYHMYNKHPDMREQYLAALVEGILDNQTKTFNRNKLIWNLSELTGVNFKKMPDNIHYEEMGPYIYTGVSEVEKWWEEHNREKLLKVQEVMKSDPYYIGKPADDKEGNSDVP